MKTLDISKDTSEVGPELLDLSSQDQEDLYHGLMETIQEYLVGLYVSIEADKQKESMLSKTQSEEERDTLLEIWGEIESYHQKKKEFAESGKSIHEWYNEEIEKAVRAVDPGATNDDMDKVKEAIAKQIDTEIEEQRAALELGGQLSLSIDNNGKEASI